MIEKDIFDIVDNFSEDELNMIMDKTYLSMNIENPLADYSKKEKIRTKLHEKLNKNIAQKQNIINTQDEYTLDLDDTELNSKRKSKKKTLSIKHKVVKRVLISTVAAMLVFVISINVSPSLAEALDKIPVLNKWVEYVDFDRGFNNIVSNGNIQEGNITVENKGAKFTVTSIAGDKLKLWIGYEFEGKGLIIVNVKFKDKVTNKELPWIGVPNAKNNYMEIMSNGLNVKEFIMEIYVYKDDAMFSKPIAELDKKTLNEMVDSLEKNKVTTLSVPISLSDTIYKSDLMTLDVNGKQVKSEIGIFKFEKLELSKSRSKVYGKLVSNDYEIIGVVNPILFDEQGLQYSSTSSNITTVGADNTICLELQGGINSTQGITFKCDGFKYISKKDKYITIDLEKKIVEPNNLGLSLINIEGSKITLKSDKKIVQFNFEAKNESGDVIDIKAMETNSISNEEQVLEFKELKDKKIILSVESVMNIEAKELTIGF